MAKRFRKTPSSFNAALQFALLQSHRVLLTPRFTVLHFCMNGKCWLNQEVMLQLIVHYFLQRHFYQKIASIDDHAQRRFFSRLCEFFLLIGFECHFAIFEMHLSFCRNVVQTYHIMLPFRSCEFEWGFVCDFKLQLKYLKC